MKKEKIIKRSLIFLTLVFAIFLIINQLYISVILPKKTFFRKEIDYKKFIESLPNKEIDYLFLGSSQTVHDVNPEFIPNSYNYATGSENYIKTYYKLKKVVERDGLKIKNVVLQVDPSTFSSKLTEKEHLFNELEIYSKFVSIREIKSVRIDDSALEIFLESNLPVIGRGVEFGILLNKPNLSIIKNGWIYNNENYSASNRTFSVQRNYELFFKNKNFSEISFRYFLKTMDYAHENQINIIFVTYPYAKEYDEMILENSIPVEDYFNRTKNEIEKKFGNKYQWRVYYDIYFDNPNYFSDSSHLNSLGAENFSRLFYEEKV